jgi:hypothetical protein
LSEGEGEPEDEDWDREGDSIGLQGLGQGGLGKVLIQ